MDYKKDCLEWLAIKGKTGYYFTPETMRFFGSRVYWNTLTPIGKNWVFIERTDNFDRTEYRYQVKKVFTNDLGEGWGLETLGEFESYADAKADLVLVSNWVSVVANAQGFGCLCCFVGCLVWVDYCPELAPDSESPPNVLGGFCFVS